MTESRNKVRTGDCDDTFFYFYCDIDEDFETIVWTVEKGVRVSMIMMPLEADEVKVKVKWVCESWLDSMVSSDVESTEWVWLSIGDSVHRHKRYRLVMISSAMGLLAPGLPSV